LDVLRALPRVMARPFRFIFARVFRLAMFPLGALPRNCHLISSADETGLNINSPCNGHEIVIQ
jgi:hypothetical protein